MTSPTANQTSARLEATFGLGRGWTSQAGQSATVWETPAYHLLWFDDAASDVELRRLWEARKGRQAYPVVLLAPSEDVHKVRVAGPSTCWRRAAAWRRVRRHRSWQECSAALKKLSFPDCGSRTSSPLISCGSACAGPSTSSDCPAPWKVSRVYQQHCMALTVPRHGLSSGAASPARLSVAARQRAGWWSGLGPPADGR